MNDAYPTKRQYDEIPDAATRRLAQKLKRREQDRTWTAGELAHQLRFVDPDTEVFIVGGGQIERVTGFGALLRRRVRPLLRRVVGIRVFPTETSSVAYIEGEKQ